MVTHAPEGTTVFNAANWAGLPIDSTCGGRGTCGKCKVRLVRGADGVSEADHRFIAEAELAAGWRLSCRAAVHGECVAEVPRLMSSPKAALLGYGQHVLLDPNVAKVYLKLDEPTLEDQRGDLTRLLDALRVEGWDVRPDPALWRALPGVLRDSDWTVTAVVVGDELIAVEPGDTSAEAYGVAVDVGTTTVVAAVVNLMTGAVVAIKSTLNGQAAFGADVISRASHVMADPGGLTVLHERIVATLNALVAELCAQAGVRPEQIYEAVAVGNATMLHLLLGITPEPISVAPFIPAVDGPVTVAAADFDLALHPRARLGLLPHLGAYVGADIVSGVLATGLVRNPDDRLRLYIDVGTNGEIVLGSRARALATAAPAGPAFEGAQIRCGMRASDGAIEGVRIEPQGAGAVRLQVIGGGHLAPIGLCGSGLIDAVAELINVGLVDSSGRLLTPAAARAAGQPSELVERLVTVDGVRAFLLSAPGQNIVLTQTDIRALQFAKGAISAGVHVLLDAMGVTPDDVYEVLLAGSFGSYINPASARTIGLVPQVPVDRIVAVGNAAGEGAKMCLLSFREREAAHQLPGFIDYLELSGRPDFNDIFMEVLAFPPPAGAPPVVRRQ
ncbi:MAG: DUF4445 domain-containing protein [Anaerolineales bacterium]|nr:DUF4445 domain-containing protein [Anaerolineales bacterium]